MPKKTFMEELKEKLANEEGARAPKGEEAPPPKKRGFFSQVAFVFRRRVIAGLLLTAPIVIGLFPVFFLYPKVNQAARWLAFQEYMPKDVAAILQKPLYGFVITLFAFLCLMYLIGLFSNLYLTKRILGLGEKLVTKIPLVNFFYKTTKQVSDLIVTSSETTNFLKTAVVEFPRRGIYAVGFVTGETRAPGRGILVNVMIPTAPTPASGFFLMVEPEDVWETNLSVETAVKLIVSCGIVRVDSLELKPYTSIQLEEKPAVADPVAPQKMRA